MDGKIRIYGFPPVCGPGARILILGSMPSARSLEQGQYYAHPRNAFWRIQAALFDEPFAQDYGERIARLERHGIALWDSAASCVRPGSLDSAISEAVPADIPALLDAHPGIGHIFFNGRAAQALFVRHHKESSAARLPCTLLPSTSPAAAAYSFEEKLEKWKCILAYL